MSHLNSTVTLSSNEIRKIFLDYFQQQQHQLVPSSSLVPAKDPTLLFTNAGMVQFKDVFLGIEQRPYTRAVSSQRCVRAGGKHNDLENVGYTKRHHTFFEMLGNFSFGDYFKPEAIKFAWKLLTQKFGIPAEKLWITVYHDDKESEAIWLNDIKVDPERFSRCGDKDNFWAMGDTGPCGPCTEIFYDHGPAIAGGPPGSPDEDGDRYVEIWNIVFMQYNRDAQGRLTALPKPCVDTGMGLERISTVLQGVHDNYDIDLFKYLLQELMQILDCQDSQNKSMRVIVDHIRATAFLIADGVSPSNEGRGYVLRRIIRRAYCHGVKLGTQAAFFYKMVAPLAEIMGDAYPELRDKKMLIEDIIRQEEEQFAITLLNGIKIYNDIVTTLTTKEIPGDAAFQLYDTYGFPFDLTADMAREQGLTVDRKGFEQAMAEQRKKSRQSQQFSIDQTQQLHINEATAFTGYEATQGEATVIMLLSNQQPIKQLTQGEEGIVILDNTPFYAESGGQVGDTGILEGEHGRFQVLDTKKFGQAYLHYGKVISGEIRISTKVQANVDESTRQATKLNHSATHLLHAALRQVLGKHVTQKGSLVNNKLLRFDFSHSMPLSRAEIDEIENLVNAKIRANLASTISVGTLEDAKQQGALALFDEKYGDILRVIKMGDFSTEVCGGTHVDFTGEIGCFVITSESALASGVRRIIAFTGAAAIKWLQQNRRMEKQTADLLKVDSTKVPDRVSQLLQQQKDAQKEIARLQQQLANRQTDQLTDKVTKVADLNVLATELKNVDRDTLRNTIDQLKQQIDNAAIVLATVVDDKVILVAAVAKACLNYFTASELLNQVASQVGGKGGGRVDMAQGGGDQPQYLSAALDSVKRWVANKVEQDNVGHATL